MDTPSRKILCISDSPEALWFYERIIVRSGVKNLQFTGVSDGREGFQKALELRPDLIITDDMLPEIGDWYLEEGWELSKKVREELGSHILAVIILIESGRYLYLPVDDWLKWLRSPLNAVFRKPFDLDEMVEKVNVLLEAVDRARAVLVYKAQRSE